MTMRKIKHWLYFCLKMLPLFLLIGFMLYMFRHNFETPVVSEITFVDVVYYTEEEFIELDQSDLSNFKFNFFDGVDSLGTYVRNGSTNSLNSIFFSSSGPRVGYLYFDNIDDSYYQFSHTSSSVESYTLDYIDDFWIKDFHEESYTLSFNYFENLTNDFNYFVKNNFNFKQFLNFNSFYDWSVQTLLNGNSNATYNIIFNVLIYELFVDVLTLMFSCLTFIVDWCRKWLEGVYKDW